MYYEIDSKKQVSTKIRTTKKEKPESVFANDFAEQIGWLGRATLGAFPFAIALDSLLIFGMGF